MSARCKIVTDSDGKFYGIRFDCPGCKSAAVLPVRWLPDGQVESPCVASQPHWGFNGDFERPTLNPSVLTRTGHYCNPDQKPGNCACDFQVRFPDEEPWPWPCGVCHSFVKDGRIEFLSDCTHALAGETVDLPPIGGDDA